MSNVARLPSLPPLTWDDCRLLVENVVDYAIFMLDTEGYVATWNAGAEKIKGYQASEIVGEHFSRFYPPEDVEAGKPQRVLEIAKAEGRIEDEGWRIRKDGSRFWASVVITALRDDHGELRGFGKVTRDLTNRRSAEDLFRQSEQRFHHLVDAVIDYAIFLLDPSGRVATWNSGASRVKGYSAAEIVGQHFSVFYTPEDRAAGRPEQILERVRRDGRIEEESWRVRKDGTRFWANVIITALHDDAGNLTGFAKVTRDLTERRQSEETERILERERIGRAVAEQAESRIRASEERYRALSQRLEIVFEGVADGITVQNRSGALVFANTAAARLCGFNSADELLATPAADVVARFEIFDEKGQPFDPEALPGRRVLAGERWSSALLRVRERRSGRERWSSVRATAVFDANGVPELAVNIWHDVSAERRVERQSKFVSDATAALGGSLDKGEMLTTLGNVLVPEVADWCSIQLLEHGVLRSVTVAHSDPTKVALAKRYQEQHPPDPEGPRGAWNVVRTGASEFYDEITDSMLVANARDEEHLALLRALGMKSVILVPIRARRRVLGVLSLIAAESGRQYERADLTLAEEVGRRAGVAIENAELYRDAQHAAKAAEDASRAKDVFLATVSHELRTPLNAILGWSKLLVDGVSDAALARPLQVIHRNAEAQVKIIDDILDVSRIISGKLKIDGKPTDLVAVAREALEVVRPSALAKSIDLELDAEEEFCLLLADSDRLRQVAWNLLSNAVKFTKPGGKVQVVLRREESTAILSVTDTGAGIEPAFLPFVFDRFMQADSSTTRRVSGLGLGLALVRHIVELHGGHVSAKSEGLGKGATFTIALPIRPVPISDHPPTAAAESEPSSRARLDGIRVLVVDDEPDARELLTVILTERGALVRTAGSAKEGCTEFEQVHPAVVISDIAMPDEDGYSFMRRLRAAYGEGRRVPSLALTAFASDDDRIRAIEAGYTTHLGKPVDPEVLCSTVANLAAVARGP